MRVLIPWLLLASACASVSTPPVPAAHFEMQRNVIILPVTIDRQGPFNMMLDTGTDPSAVDVRVVDQLRLNTTEAASPVAGSGREPQLSRAASLPHVRAGQLEVDAVQAEVVDLSSIGAAAGIRLDGVLGHSFLKDRVVQIDFPSQKVRFLSAPPASGEADRAVVPFRYADDSILIDDAWLNGTKVTALFDTGFNGSFSVMAHAISALNLQKQFDEATPKNAVGYNGPVAKREGKLDVIRIGDLIVPAPAVTFRVPGSGRDPSSYDFSIGNAFLKDYVVTIDYQRSLIYIEFAVRPSLGPDRQDGLRAFVKTETV